MNEKKYILGGGEIKAYENDDVMEFAGWMSTDGVDLTKEIVDPFAAKKHFAHYKNAGRLWLNHDPNQVLGRVIESSLEERGIRADRCRLSRTKFNEEYVWPHIKEGALSEFSIQFKSLDGGLDKKTGIYHHKEIYLIECSVVSIACNPEAVITGMKSLIPSEDWLNASLSELHKLYLSGGLKLPSEHRTSFQIDGFKDMELKESQEIAVTVPDFMDTTVLEEAKGFDPDGEELPMPNKARRDYDEICKAVHLAESSSRGSYMFRIGVPTKKGYKYDWNSVVMTMGSLLGAKGGAFIQDEEKLKAFNRLIAIYKNLDKTLPKIDGTSFDELSDNALLNAKFADVEFQEGENETISLSLTKTYVEAVGNALKNLSDESKEIVRKWVYGYADLTFGVSLSDGKDLAFIADLVAAFQKWKEARMMEEMEKMEGQMAGMMGEMSAHEDHREMALKDFAAFLSKHVEEAESAVVLNEEDDETPESNQNEQEEENELSKALKEFLDA